MVKIVKQEVWPMEISMEDNLMLSRVSDILDDLSVKMAEYELNVIEDDEGDVIDNDGLRTAIYALKVLRYAKEAY